MVGQAPLYQPFLPELPAQRGGHPAFLPLRVLSGWTDAPCSTAHPILQGGQIWFAVLPPAQTALQAVGIVLADHIIVADDDFVSLADDGYLGGSYGL